MYKKLICLTICTLLWAGLVHAQGVTTGSLTGVVLDPNGDLMPGVTVVATLPATGNRYGTVTDTTGRFRIINAKVGGPSGEQLLRGLTYLHEYVGGLPLWLAPLVLVVMNAESTLLISGTGDARSSPAGPDAFADGLVEDLISAISAWRHFPVAARNSSTEDQRKPVWPSAT